MDPSSAEETEGPAFELVYDQEFFLETVRRRNQAAGTAMLRKGGFVVVGLGCLALIAILLSGDRRGEIFLLLLFSVLILASPQLDRWLTIRNFRRSPFQNETLRISLGEDAYVVAGSISSTHLSWDAFTRAVQFEDGMLLFQGPGLCNWLPFSRITRGTPAEVAERVSTKVGEFRRR